MCMMLYLASDKPLPVVPWREGLPGLNVHALEDWEYGDDVRARFTKSHVYYVGSFQRCGCGFIGKFDEAVSCRRALRDYLADALARGATLELYSCWAGDEGVEAM